MQNAGIWIRAPFIRLVIPYCAGLLLAEALPFPAASALVAVVISLLVLIAWQLIHTRQLDYSFVAGLLIHIHWLLLGVALHGTNDLRSKQNWFAHHLVDCNALVIQPADLPSLHAKTCRFTVEVKAVVLNNHQLWSTCGKLLLYMPLASANEIQPGCNYILGTKGIQAIRSTGNPGSFNFAAYNQKKNVFHQTYKQPNQITAAPGLKQNFWRVWLTKAQKTALHAMDAGIAPPHNQLAKALLIGYREEVDKELLATYSTTGVVHVIAVSGMHLGLLFMLLQQLLVFPVYRYPFTKWIKFLMVILCTWFFAAAAGSAGSIIRAASMFSFILFAKLLRKPLDIMQSISFTALILLVVDPYWLWDAGFLLSFCALISIVVYQPLLQPLIKTQQPIVKWIWELTAVTLAAQLLTLPLCIGLFHQAPVYFLPANLIAVPLSSAALIGTLMQWLLYVIHIPVNIPGFLNYYLIHWMNSSIAHIAKLPYSTITDIQWTVPQQLIAYLLIVLLTTWLRYARASYLVWSVATLGVFTVFNTLNQIRQQHEQSQMVLHVPGKSVVLFMSGNTMLQPVNPLTPADHYVVNGAAQLFNIRKRQYATASSYITNDTIWHILQHQHSPWPLHTKPLILVLTGRLPHIVRPPNSISLVIIDGSVPERRADSWEQALKAEGYPVHNTWKKGAYVSTGQIKPKP